MDGKCKRFVILENKNINHGICQGKYIENLHQKIVISIMEPDNRRLMQFLIVALLMYWTRVWHVDCYACEFRENVEKKVDSVIPVGHLLSVWKASTFLVVQTDQSSPQHIPI